MATTDVSSLATFYIAKSGVCVNDKNEKIGNGFFANRNFEAGEQVASIKRPLVGSLDIERLLDTCANCYVWTEGSNRGTRLYVPASITLQKCAACQRFRYCSKTCQKEAWNRGHKYECKVLRAMGDRTLPKAVLACMELLSRRKHGLISDEDWKMLCRLPCHIEDFKRNESYANIELMAIGVGQFSLTHGLFDRDFIAAMYARVLSNSLTLITPTLDPLGIMIDPTLGNLNHSCDPNAYVMLNGPEVSIRTLRKIEQDEEVSISYIDTTNPTWRRQMELQSRWFFTCKCGLCLKDPAPSSQNERNRERDEILFDAYENQQHLGDPREAVLAITDAMRQCQGLSPYEQPRAALQDDLIVNLLSTGEYPLAWMHCVKRYKHITPFLFPVQSHPIRVTHTWQMAMLAAYLADTKNDVKPSGLNMGLIAMMLVKQVLDVAHLSHGPDSAFTKSVRGKAEEMIEELKLKVGKADKDLMDRELEVQRDLLMQVADWDES